MRGSPQLASRLAIHTASRRLQPHKARAAHSPRWSGSVRDPLAVLEMFRKHPCTLTIQPFLLLLVPFSPVLHYLLLVEYMYINPLSWPQPRTCQMPHACDRITACLPTSFACHHLKPPLYAHLRSLSLSCLRFPFRIANSSRISDHPSNSPRGRGLTSYATFLIPLLFPGALRVTSFLLRVYNVAGGIDLIEWGEHLTLRRAF